MMVKLKEKEQVDLLMKERFKDVYFAKTYITRDLPLEERGKQRN